MFRWLYDILANQEAFVVVYPDGQRTYPLRLSHARSMRDNFGGKIIWCRWSDRKQKEGAS